MPRIVEADGPRWWGEILRANLDEWKLGEPWHLQLANAIFRRDPKLDFDKIKEMCWMLREACE